MCHIDGEPIMINIMDISYVSGNEIVLISQAGQCLEVDEDFDEINAKLCEELNGSEG
jgi:hypothetical protein